MMTNSLEHPVNACQAQDFIFIDNDARADSTFSTQTTDEDKFNTDVVSSVSIYKQLRDKHNQYTLLTQKYSDATTEDLLYSYHIEETDQNIRRWLRDEIFFRIFFLLPYVIKKSYHVSISNFDDLMQNMSITVLKAIERFNPQLGYSFTNYLNGYFKSAVSKTFKDSNVVSVPSGRRKILRETQDKQNNKRNNDNDITTNPTEMMSYHGIEYDFNTRDANDEMVDYDEIVHNHQLIEWLEEAVSLEAELLNSEERRLIIMKYGLFGNKHLNYEAIAKIRAAEGKGSAFSRLSQIHNKAVQKISQYFDDLEINEY